MLQGESLFHRSVQTVKRMLKLAYVSRASFYRFDENAQSAHDPDMDLREAIQRIGLEWPSYADYLDAGSTWKPNPPSWREEDQERCNKLLHHHTYERVEYEKDGGLIWRRNFRRQAAQVYDSKAFLDSLPPNRQAWFSVPPQNFWRSAAQITWLECRIGGHARAAQPFPRRRFAH